MKIGLRGGHSPNCKGSMGIIDEQLEVRKIYFELVPMLQAQGHTVVNCNSNATTESSELSEGTSQANKNNCDIYMTLHMNSSSSNAEGTEVYLYDDKHAVMNSLAKRICDNFKAVGFVNRGLKYRTDFYDLRESSMPATIVETLFCNNQHDVDTYNALGGAKGIAYLIAISVKGEEITKVPQQKPQATPIVDKPIQAELPNVVFTYRVRCGEKWLNPVTNLSGYAGIKGIPFTDLSIKVNKGSVRYRVHVMGKGWLPYVTGYNLSDHNNGYAGNGSYIDAIEVYYETPKDIVSKFGYQKAQYRVAPYNREYYTWQYDNETTNGQDGYAGCYGVLLDRFQLH